MSTRSNVPSLSDRAKHPGGGEWHGNFDPHAVMISSDLKQEAAGPVHHPTLTLPHPPPPKAKFGGWNHSGLGVE